MRAGKSSSEGTGPRTLGSFGSFHNGSRNFYKSKHRAKSDKDVYVLGKLLGIDVGRHKGRDGDGSNKRRFVDKYVVVVVRNQETVMIGTEIKIR